VHRFVLFLARCIEGYANVVRVKKERLNPAIDKTAMSGNECSEAILFCRTKGRSEPRMQRRLAATGKLNRPAIQFVQIGKDGLDGFLAQAVPLVRDRRLPEVNRFAPWARMAAKVCEVQIRPNWAAPFAFQDVLNPVCPAQYTQLRMAFAHKEPLSGWRRCTSATHP
jgi:hypothetical protein